MKDLLECDNKDKLKNICRNQELKIYIEFTPDTLLHFGYYSTILKISELVQANCKVIILISDLFITDRMISDNRFNLYKKIFTIMLKFLKIDIDMIEFIRGSDFQLKPEFTMDVYKMNSFRIISCEKTLVSEIIQQNIRALNEKYLQVNARLGFDKDIEHFDFTKKYLKKLGYESVIHLIIPEQYDLKIDLLTDRMGISKFVYEKDLIKLITDYLFPILTFLNKHFTVFRREENGGSLHFDMIDKLEEAYEEEEIDKEHLISAIIHTINLFIEPIRKELKTREWKNIIKHCNFNNKN